MANNKKKISPEIEREIEFLERFTGNKIERIGERRWEAKPKPGHGVCDFCSDVGPFVVVECEPFVIEGMPGPLDYGSDANWAACAAHCFPMVHANNHRALLLRAASYHSKKYGVPLDVSEQIIWVLHKQFWKHKK